MTQAAPGGQDTNYGFEEQDSGRVRNIRLKKFSLVGGDSIATDATSTNSEQWAFYLRAKWDASYTDGGLWDSEFYDIRATGFKYGIWSRGAYTFAHSLLPQQFLNFRRFTIIIGDKTNGIPCRLTGQHGQIHFTDTSRLEFAFAGFGGDISENYNIEIDWDPNPSEVADNSSGQGESTSDSVGTGNTARAPSNVKFSHGTTIQYGYGAFIRANRGLTFEGCWFENVYGCFSISTSGYVAVENCHFANAGYIPTTMGGVTAGEGYIIKQLAGNASIEWGMGNEVFGNWDNFDNSSQVTWRRKKFTGGFNQYTDSEFKTGLYQINLADASPAGTIDVRGNNQIILTVTDQTLTVNEIISLLPPGDTLGIRPVGGNLRLLQTDGIRFPRGYSNETVFPENSLVMLYRTYDADKEWHLLTEGGHFWASQDPTELASEYNGYWFAFGTKVWNKNGGASAVMGWVVQTAGIAAPAWAISTAYTAGDCVVNGGNVYQCTNSGTSAGSGGPTGTGTGIVDGGCIWDFYTAAEAVFNDMPSNNAS